MAVRHGGSACGGHHGGRGTALRPGTDNKEHDGRWALLKMRRQDLSVAVSARPQVSSVPTTVEELRGQRRSGFPEMGWHPRIADVQ